jgi:6-methylpretetramide 4-monooxygenase
METVSSDFCIVGAGPAGLTLALLLLRSGAEVTVIEKSKSFDREYRGEILQPGAMTLLEELGVLAPARARGAYPLSRFQLVEHGRTLMNVDYRQLPGPFNFLLSIPQRNVLEALHDACQDSPGFTYLPGRSVNGLVRGDAGINGVTCGSGEQAVTVRAHCVVAADGRYSKTRRLAGVGYERLDVFDHDVLWFKIPRGDREVQDVRVFRAGGNPVLIYDSFPDGIQLGWTLPHEGYRKLSAAGFYHVKQEIMRAAPPYAVAVSAAINSLADLTLLDVFSGYATEWAVDGLVLIGDSAHTHSPIGAQGVNLAIQDAALVHPVLMASLRSGDASATALSGWVAARRSDIDKVIRLQIRQSSAMLGQSGKVAQAIRPVVAKALSHTPVFRKILNQIAFGSRPIRIQSDLFSSAQAAPRN